MNTILFIYLSAVVFVIGCAKEAPKKRATAKKLHFKDVNCNPPHMDEDIVLDAKRCEDHYTRVEDAKHRSDNPVLADVCRSLAKVLACYEPLNINNCSAYRQQKQIMTLGVKKVFNVKETGEDFKRICNLDTEENLSEAEGSAEKIEKLKESENEEPDLEGITEHRHSTQF